MLHILAHEKWFVDPTRFPTDVGQPLHAPTVYFVGGVLGVMLLLGYVWQRCGRRELIPGPMRFGADRSRMSIY